MSSGSMYIQRRLDDQWKIGMGDLDFAVPWLFVFGMVQTGLGGFKGIVIGAVVATVVGRWAGRLKADKHPAFMTHWMYWHLPDCVVPLKSTPPSCYRRMIG